MFTHLLAYWIVNLGIDFEHVLVGLWNPGILSLVMTISVFTFQMLNWWCQLSEGGATPTSWQRQTFYNSLFLHHGGFLPILVQSSLPSQSLWMPIYADLTCGLVWINLIFWYRFRYGWCKPMLLSSSLSWYSFSDATGFILEGTAEIGRMMKEAYEKKNLCQLIP